MENEANYIPEIFIYCDRWCERCPFTSQCMHFEMFKKDKITLDDLGLHPEKFWNYVDSTAPSILRSVYEIAEELDYNLRDEILSHVRSTLQTIQNPDEQISANPMIRMTEQYSSQIEIWLGNHQQALTLLQQSSLSDFYPPNANVRIHPAKFLQIIKNYQHQIYVKVLQAIEKLQEQAQLPPGSAIKHAILHESYGMAKVGIVLTDRSIAAWGLLSDFIPEANDSIFQHLILLEKIRTYIMAIFPQVQDFIRPGFDQRTK